MNSPRKSRYNLLPIDFAPTTSIATRLKRLAIYSMGTLLIGSVLLVGLLRYLPAHTSAFMLHQHIDDLVEGGGYKAIDQHWVSRSRIAKPALLAVIASEDQLFYQHNGFDLDAIYKAYQHNLRGGKVRGASTISQQVAKNLFLSPARNFGRKALEAWFTLLIELLWSKDRILEMYLNIAQFGDHLYGVEAASQHYFGISAHKLSASQAALLAASLPNPVRLKVDRPSPYLLRRKAWILQQMQNLGL